jgi:hypothetical protein
VVSFLPVAQEEEAVLLVVEVHFYPAPVVWEEGAVLLVVGAQQHDPAVPRDAAGVEQQRVVVA